MIKIVLKCFSNHYKSLRHHYLIFNQFDMWKKEKKIRTKLIVIFLVVSMLCISEFNPGHISAISRIFKQN